MKKMKITTLKKTLLTLILSSVAYSATADWNLNNKESTLNFVSTKKLTVGELHTFKNLDGVLKDNGKVSVNVTLASVDTKIPTRDERMKKELFEIVKFPKAMVSTTVDVKAVNTLKAGDTLLQTLTLNLSIHGKQKEVDALMRITALTGNKLLVSTVKPIIINASDFTLVAGIGVLKELAKLSSISTAVPVTASFIFEK
jgi:polyisoprenoid-binding protein YceI